MVNLSKTREFIQKILLKAGDITLDYFEKQNFSQKEKSGVDFVTQVDEEVDEFLRKKIQARFSTHVFLTEETAPAEWQKFKKKKNFG